MSNAMSLFDEPQARRSDPSTSRQAARRVTSLQPRWKERILEALTFRSLTDDAICLALGVDPRVWPSIKTARSALKKAGKVVWTGETRNGQRVWCLPQHARPRPVEIRDGTL